SCKNRAVTLVCYLTLSPPRTYCPEQLLSFCPKGARHFFVTENVIGEKTSWPPGTPGATTSLIAGLSSARTTNFTGMIIFSAGTRFRWERRMHFRRPPTSPFG